MMALNLYRFVWTRSFGKAAALVKNVGRKNVSVFLKRLQNGKSHTLFEIRNEIIRADFTRQRYRILTIQSRLIHFFIFIECVYFLPFTAVQPIKYSFKV